MKKLIIIVMLIMFAAPVFAADITLSWTYDADLDNGGTKYFRFGPVQIEEWT